MNKKSDCETAIRRLIHEWAKEIGLSRSAEDHPSFYAFKEWLGNKGYTDYLNFRSEMGPDYDAEFWFDEELGQKWRR